MTDHLQSPPPTGVGGVKEQVGAPDSKKHLYYGKINQSVAAIGAAVCEEFPVARGPSVELLAGDAESPECKESGTQAGADVTQHAERLRAFQIQQAACSFKIVAPTIDSDVRDALRYRNKMQRAEYLFFQARTLYDLAV